MIISLPEHKLKEALDLVWLVFFEFEAPVYDKKGVDSFREFIQPEQIAQRIASKEMKFWVDIEQNEIVGVIAVRGDSHISLLFVQKEYQRRGIAKKLIQALITHCVNENQVKHITVNASPYAVNIYAHMGFVARSGEQTVDGIRFTPMTLLLKK